MSRPTRPVVRPVIDALDITELGPEPEHAPPPSRRGRPLLIGGVLAGVLVLAALAAVLLHSPAQNPADRAAGSVVPIYHASDLPGRGFSCSVPSTCLLLSGTHPTAGVLAALRERFPTVGTPTAELYLDPTSRRVLAQYVSASAPSGLQVTVSVSDDGEMFRTEPSLRRDTDLPPTLHFDRHTLEGWAVEVTVGGTAASRSLIAAGYALCGDGRLFS